MKDLDPSNETSTDFVHNLREMMEKTGISQKEIAAVLGVRSNHLNRYFNSKTDIRSEKLLDILEYLGINVREQVKSRLTEFSQSKKPEASLIALRLQNLRPGSRRSFLRIVEQLAQ